MKSRVFTPSLASVRFESIKEQRRLWELEITETGCLVNRETPKRIGILEPLTYKVPSIARPHCCYLNTIIFYVYPHVLHRNKQNYLEWDVVDYLLSWDAELQFEGQRYIVGGGRVVRHHCGWFLNKWARLREPRN